MGDIHLPKCKVPLCGKETTNGTLIIAQWETGVFSQILAVQNQTDQLSQEQERTSG